MLILTVRRHFTLKLVCISAERFSFQEVMVVSVESHVKELSYLFAVCVDYAFYSWLDVLKSKLGLSWIAFNILMLKLAILTFFIFIKLCIRIEYDALLWVVIGIVERKLSF